MSESECNLYNLDNVFKRFKVIEFPVSFVGLATERYLDVKTNLARDAYLKTMCDGSLLKFEDAREISSSHRAFNIVQVNDNTVRITFKPINECICSQKNKTVHGNKFVFDLRLIQVNGERCCNNEFHSEIGRYYISGQYDYSNLFHIPKVISFGEVFINTEITRHVRIKNESHVNASLIESVKVTGFDVIPSKFVLHPNSSKHLKVVFKPTCLMMKHTLKFEIRNPRNLYDDQNKDDDRISKDVNFLSYSIPCMTNVKYKGIHKNIVVESMHKLNEPDNRYTYVDKKEINQQRERKNEAYKHLAMCKSNYLKKRLSEKFSTGKVKCCSDLSHQLQRLPENFCKSILPRIDTYGIFNVLFLPYSINFENIAWNTYGEKDLVIFNNTPFNITIQLQRDNCILYTDAKLTTLTVKLQAFNKTMITVLCLGYVEGSYKGTFEYLIDKKFSRKHKYSLHVGSPTLRIQEKIIKFGMINSDSFVTSVPVRIYNDFNVPLKYTWDDLHLEVPFDITPIFGEIPKRSCKICDVRYLSRFTKTKTHEVNFLSLGDTTKATPVEISVMTRKLTVKFLQQAITFKDIALNIQTIERVKLENSSREIATFFVVEPLIPGFTIKPMSGNIRPKMVITFEMIVKISCMLEFAFDVTVKINNKENVSIPVSGNVVEPKIIIHPRNIFMPRIPCGMTTYVPVTFQNVGSIKTLVEVLNTGDENVFDVYTLAQGNEKQRIFEFSVDCGQSKMVFIKVLDVFRREYDMYIPFKVNGLLGPPDQNTYSTELQHYIRANESHYENNPRVKIKTLNKDIPYCRIYGVITVSWIEFSEKKFEIDYVPNGKNSIQFSMKNVSKYVLQVTVVTSKLSPAFSLDVSTYDNQSIINESHIKFELYQQTEARFTLKFHPAMNGRFISTAILFLDKHMTIPYHNLTFVGRREVPTMAPSTYRILFPPCPVGTSLTRCFTITMGFAADLDQFACFSQDESNLNVKFIDCEIVTKGDELNTILLVEVSIRCDMSYSRHVVLNVNHECGSDCEIEVVFLFTQCILTLHTHCFVKPENNPYPYYPLSSHTELHDYLSTCTQFLEKWMFLQGFRRDLYPVIPDTFHAISTFLSTQFSMAVKSKSINVTILNFMKRIAGPMMKHFHKANALGVDESFKGVKEIHDTYKEILNVLRSRGSDLWILQAKFLLSYDQFVLYTEYVTPTLKADVLLIRDLLKNAELFHRLSKQCWIDFILQCYRVFVMDSCFFDCVCVNNQNRYIVNVLIDWFNAQIVLQHNTLKEKDEPLKKITNLNTDLIDSTAFASAMLTYCPFLSHHFKFFMALKEDDNRESGLINNACLVIEAMNLLRLYFPLASTDLLKPNFLQMLFLSIHLYVVLPMFKPRQVVHFNPPLLRSSTRHIVVSPATQESLIFTHVLLNNNRNSFTIEKAPTVENGKKMFLSVKYTANFTDEEDCVLLLHGYNKTRIFDTYIVFLLKGCIGALNPIKKCRVTGPLYRPNKVEVLVSSPLAVTTTFRVSITDKEPTIPVKFENSQKPLFYVQRLNLIEKEVTLTPPPKECSGHDTIQQKIYLQIVCLSTQVGNTWLWFRSEVGEFYIRVTTQPRWDIAMETLQAKLEHWPVDPCSCGESCECYRTTVLTIPHRNELMVKALRYAMLEHASDAMMIVFDQLIETQTGKLILGLLLEEGGTNMSDVKHILSCQIRYRITSKSLIPRLDRVVLSHHTASILPLPVTIPANDKSERYSLTFTSECGMDIRTYRIIFTQSSSSASASSN